MASNIKFQPWYLIAIGIVLFFIFKQGILPGFAVTSLIDPSTNTTYTCNSTLECYQKINITGTEPAPGLACNSGICIFAECSEGSKRQATCPDGTKVAIASCEEGTWDFASSLNCPRQECLTDDHCIYIIDTNCDSIEEGVKGTCGSDFKCVQPSFDQCTEMQLFWGQYKLYIISGVLILLGAGGMIFIKIGGIRRFK